MRRWVDLRRSASRFGHSKPPQTRQFSRHVGLAILATTLELRFFAEAGATKHGMAVFVFDVC